MSSKQRRTVTDSTADEKRPKRGQKHNKRNKRSDNEIEEQIETKDNPPPLKLTIKIGGQTLGEKSVVKSSIRGNSVSNQNETIDEQLDLSMSFDDEEEEDNYRSEEEINYEELEEPDEEEEWLDALEEGRLEEVDDELKKIRDPKLMTARQRALLENKSLKGKVESIKSIVSQETDKTLSEEMIERKLLKDRRRRQQAEEKKEKDKKQTIDRLLRKRQELAQKVKKKKKAETTRITYKNCQNGVFICLPTGMSVEQLWAPKVASERPIVATTGVKCERIGCENDKKYRCSKTKQFVCSLQCYKEIVK